MILSDEEKQFIVRILDAAFAAGCVRGTLDETARMCQLALAIREKLEAPEGAYVGLQRSQPAAEENER